MYTYFFQIICFGPWPTTKKKFNIFHDFGSQKVLVSFFSRQKVGNYYPRLPMCRVLKWPIKGHTDTKTGYLDREWLIQLSKFRIYIKHASHCCLQIYLKFLSHQWLHVLLSGWCVSELFQRCVRIFYHLLTRVWLFSVFHMFPRNSGTSHLHLDCCRNSNGTKPKHYVRAT